MNDIRVTKADGTVERFRENKLRHSLRNAGATRQEITEILRDVEKEIYDGITTEIIYRRAFELLRDLPQPAAARYSLRRALFGLGPTGFPFEDYLAKLYEHDGYRTKTRTILKGSCATHELDVIGWKQDDCFVAEAKFHQQPGTKSDLQVVLYSYARFLDLKGIAAHKSDTCGAKRGVVITNTKFTTAAIQYGACVGMDLIGWDYPRGKSLQEWIERTKLYPITVLSSLKNREKLALIKSGTILCGDIIDNKGLLTSIGVSRGRSGQVMDEGAKLCAL